MIERIEINLLPAEYRYHKRHFRLSRELFYPVLFVIIIGIAAVFGTLFMQNSLNYQNSQINYLSQQIDQNRPIQNEITRLRSEKLAIQEKNRALERINVNREKWVKLMEELSRRLPEYTWLVTIKEENSNPPELSVEGRTYSFPDVANYMSNLKESKYISSVGLTNIEQIDSKENLFKFFITCIINPDVNLGLPADESDDAVIMENAMKAKSVNGGKK
jgi:Tfp pilus assembly protein PilN